MIGYEDYFEIQGGHQPFAGSGVVVGRDSKGHTVSAKSTADDVRPLVDFVHRDTLVARYSRSRTRPISNKRSHT
jgi:hypothetical protein